MINDFFLHLCYWNVVMSISKETDSVDPVWDPAAEGEYEQPHPKIWMAAFTWNNIKTDISEINH